MALKHILQLDIPETACETVLKISDVSLYADQTLLPVDCQRLDITLPGMVQPIYIEEADGLQPGFTKLLGSSDLQDGAESGLALPDGVYTIKYSVAPNNYAYVSYYHLRTTQILNRYYSELCKIHLQECEPSAEIKQNLEDLRYIKSLIDGAKAKVEHCHAPNQGIQMITYAGKLLDKYVSGCCLTCR